MRCRPPRFASSRSARCAPDATGMLNLGHAPATRAGVRLMMAAIQCARPHIDPALALELVSAEVWAAQHGFHFEPTPGGARITLPILGTLGVTDPQGLQPSFTLLIARRMLARYCGLCATEGTTRDADSIVRFGS